MNFKERIENPAKSQVLGHEDYFIWCGSVVADEKGKYHMFASRWEKSKTFKAWLTASRIVRAESNYPEGPFTIVEELNALLEQEWSNKSVHNPTVIKINGKYCLYYMGTTYSDSLSEIPEQTDLHLHPARFNQRIGMAIASSPDGSWVPSVNNPVLSPRKEGYWDSTFVCNPSAYVDDDHKILLIYKAKYATDNRLMLGLAVADSPQGPFERTDPSPLLEHDVEDPFIWKEDSKYWMIAKDMSGALVGPRNGVLYESNEGLYWQISNHALAWDHEIQWKDGGHEHPPYMERPQLFIENGKPVCFYTAVGDNETYSYNLARRIR